MNYINLLFGGNSSRPSSGESRIFGSDKNNVSRVRKGITFTFLKKNVRDANGDTYSLSDAIRNTKGTFDYYDNRVSTAPTFEQYYKTTGSSSILMMTGHNSWDKKTARKYYNSWLDSAKIIRDESREALKSLEDEEKRRKKK